MCPDEAECYGKLRRIVLTSLSKVVNTPDFKNLNGLWVKSHTPEFKTEHVTYLYQTWCKICVRCSANGYYQKKKPSYIGCTNAFGSYQSFCEWAVEQVGYGNFEDNGESWALDKDLLYRGNKIYGPDTCVFIPREINSVLVNPRLLKRDLPLGVYKRPGRRGFYAIGRENTKQVYLGVHDTVEQAFQMYLTAKQSTTRRLAEKWKGRISDAAYNALINYTIDITD